MGFFQVDASGGVGTLRPRKPKALPAGPSAATHKAAPSKPAPRPTKTKSGGIDLDLTADSDDADFEKF